MLLETESAQADDKFTRDVIDIRRQVKQRHETAPFDGIRVSVPISSVPISSDIGTLVPQLLSHIFNCLIFIATAVYKKKSILYVKILSAHISRPAPCRMVTVSERDKEHTVILE